MVQAIATTKNNQLGGHWFYITLAMNMCPLWAIVSRYSKNLIFDGLLYDLCIMLPFISVMFYYKQMAAWAPINWFGLVVVLVGLACVKA